MEEIKTLGLVAYLVFYDLEKRLFFPLDWTGMGLGVKPRVWVPALLAGLLGTWTFL